MVEIILFVGGWVVIFLFYYCFNICNPFIIFFWCLWFIWVNIQNGAESVICVGPIDFCLLLGAY